MNYVFVEIYVLNTLCFLLRVRLPFAFSEETFSVFDSKSKIRKDVWNLLKLINHLISVCL